MSRNMRPGARPRGPQLYLYVTRNAALDYQGITGAGFETARRQLTRHLLKARPDPEQAGALRFKIAGDHLREFRAYTAVEEEFRVVTKVAEIR